MKLAQKPSLWELLRQGINNVVICVYLSYSHISSDEMEALKSVFGSFDEIWVSLLTQSLHGYYNGVL
ncbi:hypothetical protein V6N13_139983 [Hibiscus sabdariffa]